MTDTIRQHPHWTLQPHKEPSDLPEPVISFTLFNPTIRRMGPCDGCTHLPIQDSRPRQYLSQRSHDGRKPRPVLTDNGGFVCLIWGNYLTGDLLWLAAGSGDSNSVF
ncbi:unnamed protein product [Nezara viridula]|uniref:Uncharacterized protein n=1 Tax=Nezara viridula TaxID=85310 RepID=A0A9P0HPJ6_NEZVI|nr:unnamed protein product [Nezara viridula]